jgi:cell wall-associated NlpC family hydrolase
MSSWAVDYVGLPFLPKGRTRQGVDCYGLVRLIYQEQRGIDLPSYTEDYATTTDHQEITSLLRGEVGSRWREIPVEQARSYDGLVFRIAGQPTHFGMVLEPPRFIHAISTSSEQTGKVCIERWDSWTWERRLVGVVRWGQHGH